METTHARLRRGLSWNAASALTTHLLNFARYAIVARLLPLESFGQFALANVAVMGAWMFSNWGWRQAFIVQQEAGMDPARRQNALWTADLAVRCTALLLLWLLAVPIELAFGQSGLAPLIAVGGLYVLGQPLRHPALMDRERELQFDLLARIDLAGAIGGLLVTVALALWLGNVWALVLGQVAAALVPAWLSHLAIRRPVALALDVAMVRQGFAHSRNILVLSVLAWVTTQLDNAFIGVALGAGALGLYAVAYRLSEIPKLVQDAVVNRTVYPYYVKAALLGAESLRAAWTMTGRYCLWLLVAAYLPMALVPELLLDILFGANFAPAAEALRVLAAVGFLRGVNSFLAPVLMSLQRTEIDVRIKLVETVVFLVLAIWGAFMVRSIEAVALAGVVSWGGSAVARLAVVAHLTGQRGAPLAVAWRVPLAALLAAALALPRLDLPDWGTLLAVAAWIGAAFLLAERAQLSRFIGRP